MVYQYRPLDLAIHRYNQRFFRDIASVSRNNFTITHLDAVETTKEGVQKVKVKVSIDRHLGLDPSQIASLGPIPQFLEKTVYTTRHPLNVVLSTVVPCDDKGRYVLNVSPGSIPSVAISQALNQLGLMISPTELKVKVLSAECFLLTVENSLIAYGNAYLYRDTSVSLYGSDRLCDFSSGVDLSPTEMRSTETASDEGDERCGIVTKYQQFSFDRSPSVCLDTTALDAKLTISLVRQTEHNPYVTTTDLLAQAIQIKPIVRGVEIFVQGRSVQSLYFEPGTWVSIDYIVDKLIFRFSSNDTQTQTHTITLNHFWQGSYFIVLTAKKGFNGVIHHTGLVDETLTQYPPATPRLQRIPMIYGDTYHIIERLVNKGLWKHSIPLTAAYTTHPIMNNDVRCIFTDNGTVIGQVDYEQPKILDILTQAAADNDIPFDGRLVFVPTVQAQSPGSLENLVSAINEKYKTPFLPTDFEHNTDVFKTRGIIWCNPKQGQYVGGFYFQCVQKTLG